MRIVGSWGRLGMILHGESRYAAMPHPLQGLVIQIHVRQFDLACIQRIRVNGKTMVLCCDFHAPGKKVLHRLVPSPMPEFKLKGLCSEGFADQLVTKANTHYRHLI